jgi:hypothetical protein
LIRLFWGRIMGPRWSRSMRSTSRVSEHYCIIAPTPQTQARTDPHLPICCNPRLALRVIAATKHLSEELTISSRPDLSSAPRVVSGGRALKSAEQFNSIMEPLADSLTAGKSSPPLFSPLRAHSRTNEADHHLNGAFVSDSHRSLPSGRRCGIRRQLAPSRSDWQSRRSRTLHGCRDLGSYPASRRNEGEQDDRRYQQGQSSRLLFLPPPLSNDPPSLSLRFIPMFLF